MARHNGKRRRSRGLDYEVSALVDASRRLLDTPRESLDLLERADIVGHQVVPTGSNYTFLVVMVPAQGDPFLGVYKPKQGENPLWDYPDGTLYQRERAAYVASVELGWPNIPPTVIREQGPYGVGMAQLYVPPEPQQDLFSFKGTYAEPLMEIALFDILVNNGDRKAGHCLLGVDGRLWAIDHGLTFNHATRLRTVLWDYCGERIPQRLLDTLGRVLAESGRKALRSELLPYLSSVDLEALFNRAERIVRAGRYPQLDPDRNIPWPLV